MDLKVFKSKYEKVKVQAYPHAVTSTPKVSICVQTYQHANYIRACLDGILHQQTNFSCEILLGEDNSNDGTREICKEYAEKYPNQIRLFLHHRANNIKIDDRPTGRFSFLYNLYHSRGEYIAICEGDDYWTDPMKLQKQVDFLEENPEYAICCHNSKIIDEKGNAIQRKKLPKLQKDRDYSRVELKKGAFILTLSMVFRNVVKEFPSSFPKVLNGDTFLISLLGRHGKGKYIEEIEPAAYRAHKGGIWSKIDQSKRIYARMIFNKYLMNYYKQDAELYTHFYQKQIKTSRDCMNSISHQCSFKYYIKFNLLYLKYNPVLRSRYRLKILLKNNWHYWTYKH